MVIMTDDDVPKMKHTNIQGPTDQLAEIRRAQRHLEDVLDRTLKTIARMSMNIDALTSRKSWLEYLAPLCVGTLIGLFIGWYWL
jgi:hypothetical protein